jgi:hypothetical protein
MKFTLRVGKDAKNRHTFNQQEFKIEKVLRSIKKSGGDMV